jgi:dihydroorotase-like cyclic amidohydrolase
MHDLLFRGGTVVTPDASEPLDLVVDGERVTALGPPGSFGRGAVGDPPDFETTSVALRPQATHVAAYP